VDERMRPEGGEDAHLLLGVVQGVESPQRGDAVVRPMRQPVAAVHGHEAGGDSHPRRDEPHRRQHEPRCDMSQRVGEPDTDDDNEGTTAVA
jgi:hypothetical protein